MTSPTPMTREEMLELAALDAFGLLDPFEAERYTRSFHDAPAALQDQIVDLQAVLSLDQTLMPDEEPPADLRQRVLAAVSRAIERDTVKFAPIATIGRPRSRAADIVGRIGLSGAGQFWRAAAFFLMAGVVTMAYLLTITVQGSNQVAKEALSNATGAQIERLIGPTFVEFLRSPNAQRFVLVSDTAGDSSWATVFYNEKTREAFLVTHVPQVDAPVYSLTVQTASGAQQVVGEAFASDGNIRGHRFSLDKIQLASNTTWQISGPRGVVVRSI